MSDIRDKKTVKDLEFYIENRETDIRISREQIDSISGLLKKKHIIIRILEKIFPCSDDDVKIARGRVAHITANIEKYQKEIEEFKKQLRAIRG